MRISDNCFSHGGFIIIYIIIIIVAFVISRLISVGTSFVILNIL
jgi:hypothetical protein